MVINNEVNNVKFISYTGEYPNLCSGTLILKINGKIYHFGYDGFNKNNYPKFWSSGGYCDYTEEHIEQEEWIIDSEKLPEELRQYSYEIDKVFNENVPYGCCGGCI